MKTLKKPLIVLKIFFVLCLLIYINNFEVTLFTNKIDAVSTLLFSFLLLYKSRNNLPVTLAAFFIFYCNYSIIMGEYLTDGRLGIPVYEVKTVAIYGITIRALLLFTAIITLLYNGKSVNLSKFKLIPKDNILIFYSLFFILIYILLFEVNRGNMNSYSVRISPIYEYSYLLFLFSYYSSGKSIIRRFLIVSLLTLFVLQDFYYGGRITALQIILLFTVTIFVQKLSFKFIIFSGFVGILLNSLIGVYRSNYSLNSINLLDIFINLKNSFFVFSTPVFAYYASATHVAASQIVSLNEKLRSLIAFINSIFVGSNNEISNLTIYVSNNYFLNIGGGVIPSHFYFWMGWTGVILISSFLVLLLNKIGGLTSDFQKLCFIIVITTVPRWYLYSPLSLFRPLILLTILYIVFITTHKILLKVSNRNRIIKTNPLNNLTVSKTN